MLKNLLFWRKFIRYLLVGFSALIILAGFNYVDGFQRGPLPASAEEVGFISSGESNLPMDGFPVGFISTGEQPLPGTQTQPVPAPICHETQDPPYGQCGSDVLSFGRTTDSGGNSIISTHQYEVIRINNAGNQCGAISYTAVDRGEAAVCGAPQPPPPPPPPPPPGPDPRGQQYSACGISGQLWDANVGGTYSPLQPSDCGSNQFLHVYPPDGNGYITNACENIPAGGERDGDGCGWHQAAAPAPAAPAPAAPAPAAPITCGRQEVDEGCVDNGFRSFRVIDTCGGFSSSRRVWDPVCASTTFDGCQEFVTAGFCSSQSFRTERVRNTCDGIGEFTRTVWDSNCGFFQSPFCTPTEIFSSDTCVANGIRQRVFTNSCTGGEMRRERFFDGNCLVSGPVVTQPVITQPVVTQPVVITAAVPVQTFGNVGVARVITAQAPAVQVQGVKELPKTGLPLLAWAALAFIPAGFKIRGFSKVKMETAAKPHFLHEERQFNLDN